VTLAAPPGIEKPRRLRPKWAWELLACSFRGHELLGTDVATITADDAIVVREHDGLRWHRCLRCDSWLPLPPPTDPTLERMPPRDQIEVPLRGRPLRDRFVLRAIAIDRIVHFVLLAALTVAILIFAHDRERLRGSWTRIINRLQGATGGPLTDTHRGLLHDVDRLFAISASRLLLYAALIGVYALVNLIEAVGLWRARRWAEYLAVIEVLVLFPIDIHELTIRVSPLKIVALIVSIAIVVYLLVAHRLFGIRGGGKVMEAERERDTGWPALERTAI
jgi:uncharacterized membrane protein (DUF2068 family)